MKLTPSTSRIYQHLVTAGSISQREAMVEYSTGSLTKEISNLRTAGVQIDTVRKTHPITGKRYARYVLA
jgi:biotin operon repressor